MNFSFVIHLYINIYDINDIYYLQLKQLKIVLKTLTIKSNKRSLMSTFYLHSQWSIIIISIITRNLVLRPL